MSRAHSSPSPRDELQEVQEDMKLLEVYSVEILSTYPMFKVLTDELEKILSDKNPSEPKLLAAVETIKGNLSLLHDQLLRNSKEDIREPDILGILCHNQIKLINNVNTGLEETPPPYYYESYARIKEKLKPCLDVLEFKRDLKRFESLLKNISISITTEKTPHFEKPHVKNFIVDLENIKKSTLSINQKYEKTILLLNALRHTAQGNKAIKKLASMFNSSYESESRLKKDCANILEQALPNEFNIQKQTFEAIERNKIDSLAHSPDSQKTVEKISPYQAQQIIIDQVMQQFESKLKSTPASKLGLS